MGKRKLVITIFETVATLGTLSGLLLIALGHGEGWILSSFASIAWLAYAYEKNLLGLFITNTAILAINVVGVIL